MVKKLIERLFRNSENKNLTTVGTSNETSRVSWIKKTLENIPSGERILDAGAGEQPYRKFCTHLNYVSQDFAKYKPDSSQLGVKTESWEYGDLNIISDISSIPEENES